EQHDRTGDAGGRPAAISKGPVVRERQQRAPPQREEDGFHGGPLPITRRPAGKVGAGGSRTTRAGRPERPPRPAEAHGNAVRAPTDSYRTATALRPATCPRFLRGRSR